MIERRLDAIFRTWMNSRPWEMFSFLAAVAGLVWPSIDTGRVDGDIILAVIVLTSLAGLTALLCRRVINHGKRHDKISHR